MPDTDPRQPLSDHLPARAGVSRAWQPRRGNQMADGLCKEDTGELIFPSSQRRGGCAERSEGADGVARSASPIGRSLKRRPAKHLAELTINGGFALLLRLRAVAPPLLCEEGNI